MKTVIKQEYQDKWFAVPKVLVEGYMPTIGINAFALYIILSYYQEGDGKIYSHLIRLRDKSDMRNMKILRTLDYLKRMRLVTDTQVAGIKAIELSFSAQPLLKKK